MEKINNQPSLKISITINGNIQPHVPNKEDHQVQKSTKANETRGASDDTTGIMNQHSVHQYHQPQEANSNIIDR